MMEGYALTVYMGASIEIDKRLVNPFGRDL